jgi:hypothetical protein
VTGLGPKSMCWIGDVVATHIKMLARCMAAKTNLPLTPLYQMPSLSGVIEVGALWDIDLATSEVWEVSSCLRS